MDAIAGVTTKAIDTLKSVPTWVLVGLSASLAAIWLLPSIADALPELLRPFLPIALLVVSVLTVCNVSSLLITRFEEERRLSLAKDRERLLSSTDHWKRFFSPFISRSAPAQPRPACGIASQTLGTKSVHMGGAGGA